MCAAEKRWPRRCWSTPGPGPQKGMQPVDTMKSSAPAHRPEVAAGDPFAYAGRDECPACYRGVVYLTYEEDGHEWTEPVPCRRCNPS